MLTTKHPRPLSLAEQIANHVADQVFEGHYQPGEAIPEQRLAEYFQVSRGPVREALRILEKEGVITLNPRRGAQVTNLTATEVDDIFVIRATLFGLAARLFVENHTAEHLTRLRAGLENMRTLVAAGAEADEHARQSAEMAIIVLEGCGNQRLNDVVLQLARQIARYTKLGLSNAQRRRKSLESWQRLTKAIVAGDQAKAEAVAREMVANTREHAMRVLTADRK